MTACMMTIRMMRRWANNDRAAIKIIIVNISSRMLIVSLTSSSPFEKLLFNVSREVESFHKFCRFGKLSGTSILI